MRIANAYEAELVAQRLTKEDIEYISENLIPVLTQLAASSTVEPAQAPAVQGIVQSLVSVETVTVLQLVGFNFRKAIGEPLTELVARFITTRGPGVTSDRPAPVPHAGNRRR